MDNIVCGRCSASQIIQFRRCIFSKNIYIFRHLKLEIALAIPASNDEKYNWNNSAGLGLTIQAPSSQLSTPCYLLCVNNCNIAGKMHNTRISFLYYTGVCHDIRTFIIHFEGEIAASLNEPKLG